MAGRKKIFFIKCLTLNLSASSCFFLRKIQLFFLSKSQYQFGFLQKALSHNKSKRIFVNVPNEILFKYTGDSLLFFTLISRIMESQLFVGQANMSNNWTLSNVASFATTVFLLIP